MFDLHKRSNLCDPGSLLTQDRSTHRVKIVSTHVGSVRVKRPLGSILVLLVVRGPGNPNKEIASFPIGIFRNPLTGDPRVSASETALGSRTKDEYSSMNEDVSNPTLFGGSSGEYMDSLGSVYNSSGHCSCPHTSSQTTLGHPVLQQLLGDSAAAFEHRAQLLQQESVGTQSLTRLAMLSVVLLWYSICHCGLTVGVQTPGFKQTGKLRYRD